MKLKVLGYAMAAAAAALFSTGALANCPVNKRGGGTWCSNGWEWKCERCGSEYCSIMTGRKCVKDDATEERSAQRTPLLAALSREIAYDSLVLKPRK